ncbi:MAG: hypothetical protein KY469_09740 [Actinobacteria bacterium]|nr:hypothetical protein [Actinomycetota bacterium]
MGVRFNPAVDQAVTRAVIRGLADRQSSGSIVLTHSGREHLTQLLDAGLMSDVVQLLNELPQPITQSRVVALLPTSADVEGVSL